MTKPGIIYGNSLMTAGGFLLASGWNITIGLFAATIVGTALVIASACVCNNYLDRKIDAKMSRTKKRALVSGIVPVSNALIFAAVLGVTGFVLLLSFTNALTTSLAMLAFVAYVALYGLAKRRTVHGTLVGTISGASPPVIGYTAVTNSLDGGALILFLIMVCWQMPHFYAIAMYRLKDYQAANIPVRPAVKGNLATKRQIIAYIIAFALITPLLSVFGYAGYSFAAVMLVISLIWLGRALRGLNVKDDTVWARRQFGFSLIVLLSLSAMLSLSPLLP